MFLPITHKQAGKRLPFPIAFLSPRALQPVSGWNVFRVCVSLHCSLLKLPCLWIIVLAQQLLLNRFQQFSADRASNELQSVLGGYSGIHLWTCLQSGLSMLQSQGLKPQSKPLASAPALCSGRHKMVVCPTGYQANVSSFLGASNAMWSGRLFWVNSESFSEPRLLTSMMISGRKKSIYSLIYMVKLLATSSLSFCYQTESNTSFIHSSKCSRKAGNFVCSSSLICGINHCPLCPRCCHCAKNAAEWTGLKDFAVQQEWVCV